MSRKYYAKHREIFDFKENKIRNVYTPTVFIKGRETYVSDNGEIIELKDKDEALKIAKDTYKRINKEE
ncbi:hypothetical protein G6Z25_02040 [Clostridium perfringens]|uniref:hypothetical protein n=1 Tax=Clostridium perfringens TaxID=1502 RepID=UPI0013E38192|nr:hypothetical protein [Clostridium perfringens]NGS95699.1 hypothetical protein [Clostridium perfringens]